MDKEFSKLLRDIKKSRGARQGIIEQAVRIAIEDINRADNTTKLTQLLLSGEYLEAEEVHLVTRWLKLVTTIERITAGKSTKGNKVVKVVSMTPKIEWSDDMSLYDFQQINIKMHKKAFDSESLINRLVALITKAEAVNLDFAESLQEAKKRAKKKDKQKALKAKKQ